MKIAIVGSRHLGSAVLRDLVLAGHEVAGAVVPDASDRLAQQAERFGVPVIDLAGRSTVLESDIGARLGAIGYHPSLLPRHRGRDAVAWTIRCGDPVAGGSVYQLTPRMDGGPIAAQDWCFVRRGETARELWERALSPMGVRLLRQVVDAAAAQGALLTRPQAEDFVTWAPGVQAA